MTEREAEGDRERYIVTERELNRDTFTQREIHLHRERTKQR